jgi:hypothetical protein
VQEVWVPRPTGRLKVYGSLTDYTSESSQVKQKKLYLQKKIKIKKTHTVENNRYYLHESNTFGDFWEVKSSGCENPHATEVKCLNIPLKAKFHTKKEAKWTSKPQKIQNLPASIPHFPAETTF